jgi:hypothetical protein
MSPNPEFWTEVKSGELAEAAGQWALSRFDTSRDFACTLTTPNGKKVLGIMTAFRTGEGYIAFPIKNTMAPQNSKDEFIDKAVENNMAQLGNKDGDSVDKLTSMGLEFQTDSFSTYCSVFPNVSGIYGSDGDYYCLTLNTHKSRKLEEFDLSYTTPAPEVALGVATDIADTLPGFILEPINPVS